MNPASLAGSRVTLRDHSEPISEWRWLAVVLGVSLPAALLAVTVHNSRVAASSGHVVALVAMLAGAAAAQGMVGAGGPRAVAIGWATCAPWLAWTNRKADAIEASSRFSPLDLNVSPWILATVAFILPAAAFVLARRLQPEVSTPRSEPSRSRGLQRPAAAMVALLALSVLGVSEVPRRSEPLPMQTALHEHARIEGSYECSSVPWADTCYLPAWQDAQVRVDRACNWVMHTCTAEVAVDGVLLPREALTFKPGAPLVIRSDEARRVWSVEPLGVVPPQRELPVANASRFGWPDLHLHPRAVLAVGGAGVLALAAAIVWLWLLRRTAARAQQGREAFLNADGVLEQIDGPPLRLDSDGVAPGMVIVFAAAPTALDYRASPVLKDAAILRGTKYQHLMHFRIALGDLAPVAVTAALLATLPLTTATLSRALASLG